MSIRMVVVVDGDECHCVFIVFVVDCGGDSSCWIVE